MIIGSGIDIIEVSRIRQAFKKWGNAFLSKIFTSKEIENAKERNFSLEHLAGRFAAKEAVIKAFGGASLKQFHKIEILNDKQGKPFCSFKKKGHRINVSISHTKNYAVASAIIEKAA